MKSGLENSISGYGFIENKGQVIDVEGNSHKEILFMGDCSNGMFFLKKNGLSYLLNDGTKGDVTSLARVDIEFIGSSTNPVINPLRKQDFFFNYYADQLSHEQVSSYQSVEVKNIYHGIDVLYKKQQTGFKYDILVNPFANPDNILIQYTGADKLEITNGVLKAHTANGTIGEWMPKVYQVINEKIVDVVATYELVKNDQGKSCVKFNIEKYDRSQRLVIDPWVTFFGSVREDIPGAIETDANGNLIVTGETKGFSGIRSFPTTTGVFQFASGGVEDAFVAKFSPGGNLIWASYFGGSGTDIGIGVAIDKTTNEIYFSGTTASVNFPVTSGAYKTSLSVGTVPAFSVDGFIAKMNISGQRIWATYYGGTKVEQELRLSADQFGNVYSSGATSSTNLPVPGAFQNTLRGLSDAFLSKWDASGNLIWATYCGGSLRDELTKGGNVATDLSGNIYMVGTTQSNDFPFTVGSPYQPAFGGGSTDGFIIKFSAGGTPLWASYMGGYETEVVYDVATDGGMNVIVTGRTYSSDFKTTVGSYQPVFASSSTGTEDIFIVKFNATGNCMWSTFMGGTGRDYGCAVAIDNSDNIIISGVTLGITPMHHDTSNFPVTSCAFQTSFGGVEDNIFARFSPTGQLMCSSYIGGSNGVGGPHSSFTYDLTAYGGVAVYDGWIYVAGYTKDNNYPVTPGAFQTLRGGDNDAVLIQMCALTCGLNEHQVDFISSKQKVCKGENVSFTSLANACDLSETKYEWTFTGATPSTSTNINPTVIYNAAGTFSVKLKIVSPCDEDSLIKSMYITVSDPSATISVTNVLCNGDSTGSASVTVSGGVSPYAYSWSSMPVQTSASLSGLYAGNYSLQVTDSFGCVSTNTFTILQPSPVVLNVSSSQNGCIGQSVTLSSSAIGGVGGYIYSWFPVGPVVSFTTAATITLTITATDSNGCISKPETVNVTGKPLPEVSFTSDKLEGCGPLCINFSEATTAGSLLWNFGDGDSSSSTSPNHCYTTPGKYDVILFVKDANGCTNTARINQEIEVFPSPVAAYVVNPSVVSSLDPNVKFIDQSIGATSWEWRFGDLVNSQSTMQHPSFVYPDSGSYLSELWVTNEYGCTDSASVLISVIAESSIYIPNTFTPNDDGKNDVFIPLFNEGNVDEYKMLIYNRWGGLLFTGSDFSKGWDGRFNNFPVQQDVYIWKLNIKYRDGKIKSYIGHVNLLR